MLQQVWAAVDEKRWEEAQEQLQADPALLASRAGQLTLGYILAHTGHFPEARDVYRHLREAHAGDPWEHIALHQLGMVERLAGQHREALRLFAEERDLITRLPPQERAFKRAVNGYELGVNHLALGEVDAARTALNAAFGDAREADDSMTLGCVHRALGDLAAHVGHPDTAQQEYRQAQAAFQAAEAERAAADVRARLDVL